MYDHSREDGASARGRMPRGWAILLALLVALVLWALVIGLVLALIALVRAEPNPSAELQSRSPPREREDYGQLLKVGCVEEPADARQLRPLAIPCTVMSVDPEG
jgi:uncharacterized protein (DUF58 family)